jgi:hypothetical protein
MLPPVPELPELSEGAFLHSRFMVKNDVIEHSESRGNPWYTEAGDRAARNGNIFVSSREDVGFEAPIDMWMTGPFHMIGIIDPRLSETGYGDFSEAGGSLAFGATLDVLSKREAPTDDVRFPVIYPAEGREIWNLAYMGNESPDPLTGCPGYTAPTGPPIALQLGTGNVTPEYRASRIRTGGRELDHCVFDETSYANPSRPIQDLGRGILRMRSALVLLPRQPLVPGALYEVEVQTADTTYEWSFPVSALARMGESAGYIR